MSNGEWFDRQILPEGAVPSEWQEIKNAIQQLEEAGWTVEPVVEGIREDPMQPWLEMTKPISKDVGIQEMKRFILKGMHHNKEWPHDWQLTIEADIENANYIDEIKQATYYAKLGYIGRRHGHDLERFISFTYHLADVFAPKRSWRERWLGRLGLSAGQ